MQPKQTKLSLAIGAICFGVSTGVYAASESFDITVQTLPEVSITQITPLSYGTNVITTTGNSCQMDAATPGAGPAQLMQYRAALAAADAEGGTFGDLSGSGCVTGSTGTPGKYRISGGLAGATVNITIGSVVGTDFDFTPDTGCIVNYDATTTPTADTCTSFTADVQTSRKLAIGTTEDVTGAGVGTGSSVAGELVFTVGGTIDIGTQGADLVPNQSYAEVFPVTVVYP